MSHEFIYFVSFFCYINDFWGRYLCVQSETVNWNFLIVLICISWLNVFHLYGSFLLLLHELPALIFWLFFYQELDIFLSSLVIPFYIMSINSLCVKLVANIFSNLSFTFNFYDFLYMKNVLSVFMYYCLWNSFIIKITVNLTF